MDTDPPTFEFEHLVEAKNCLLRVLQVAEEQDNMIDGLAAAEKNTAGLDFTNCRGAFSMLEANSKSNERFSSRVDKHMNELRERIMAKREVDLNQRLALLTILTAIFMPLTLLTGIWGMNFEYMPELSAEGAYYKVRFLVRRNFFLISVLSRYVSIAAAGSVWNANASNDSCILLPPCGVDRDLMPIQCEVSTLSHLGSK